MKAIRIIMFSIMVLLIGSGAYALSSYGETGRIKAASVSQPISYVEATNMNVSFKMSGRISEIYVKEGDHVKKGQLLARLESKELQDKAAQAQATLNKANAGVEQAQAALEAANAGVKQAQAGVSAAEAKKTQGQNAVNVTAQTAERKVAQAQAAVKAAQAQLDALKNGARKEEREQAKIKASAAKEAFRIAEDNYNRMKTLFQQGAVPQAKVDEAKLNYEKAKAEYEAAQKQLEMVQNGPRPEEIKAAEAQLEQAKAAAALAEASKGEVKLRESDVQAAEAGISQASSSVSSAQANVTKAQATVNEANASVEQARAALAEAKTYLSYTELRAPSDGIITSQSAQIGELVGAGFPVFTIETTQDRWAKFYFPETELSTLKVGDIVNMKLISTGKMVKGKVTVIEPAADFAIQKPSQKMGDTDIRSFGVKVTLINLPDTVATGMTLQWQGKGAK
ncbi:HlyD family secretion protein [Aneurinibacillus thermoaerophilus]|uniref:Efflux RND transporter periplasmic adaptor subunit n=1 Tax=Aneurinibacillus thermoaerophilus TaxID=143495 RepID=A0A1G8BD54_ANETH|nr:efflux RND transporter periplasmic adaptor subunit [Aneurinibacillus thermoaerophilus]MED0676298.1 efflux RND transporter periplasmic adaptor subunit [Aneurinibacillus thermoaerophilus]MED0678689.1 efflux RND transporter periplasmic adaptor subunit [Aneurinibacillus thermoaerophilus]MED0736621.1 efflux RND transporter periplasmic adaptor subunit [Aneurinibacillus thermoaerophilus]MED0755799.1 efflux RND transporter periplasmic adaptor subunit [Aneurinibacillus thermoaerophilus]MED0759553.1 